MEENICRVCRSSESTGQDPLFYPCKCSGSMKWVHQSCLENWLKVSRNSKCEICNFEFKFSSVYSSDTPDSLPIGLLINSLKNKTLSFLIKTFRILLVVFCWTVLAPLGTLYIYNTFFRSVSESLGSLKSFFTSLKNISLDNFDVSHEKLLEFGLEIGKTVFRGQIVTLGIVFIIIMTLALQELVHSTTPEEELREFQAQRERERVNLRLKEISEKTKEELVEELSEILDRTRKNQNTVNVVNDREKVSENDSTGYSTGDGIENEDLKDLNSEKEKKDEQVFKPKNTIRKSRLPVPSPGSSKGFKKVDFKGDQSFLMKKMMDTSVEKVSLPFLGDPGKIKGKNKLEFFQERAESPETFERFCDFCSNKISSGVTLCKECEDGIFNAQELLDARKEESQINDSFWNSGMDVEESMIQQDLTPSSMWYYSEDPDNLLLVRGPYSWIKMENLVENKVLTPLHFVKRADQSSFVRLEEILQSHNRFSPHDFFDNEHEKNMEEILDEINEIDNEISGLIHNGPSNIENTQNLEQGIYNQHQEEEVQVLAGPDAAVVENNAGEQQQAFLNINIGPDLRVEIEAQGEWNSVMELIGLAGPLKNLFNSMLLYFGIIIFGLTVGIAVPRSLGHFTIVIMNKFILPIAHYSFGQISYILQTLTDPIIEPIVDFILFLCKRSVPFVVDSLNSADMQLKDLQDSYSISIIEMVRLSAQFLAEQLHSNVALNHSIILSKEIAQNITAVANENTSYGADSQSDSSVLVFLSTIFIGYFEMLLYKLRREVRIINI